MFNFEKLLLWQDAYCLHRQAEWIDSNHIISNVVYQREENLLWVITKVTKLINTTRKQFVTKRQKCRCHFIIHDPPHNYKIPLVTKYHKQFKTVQKFLSYHECYSNCKNFSNSKLCKKFLSYHEWYSNCKNYSNSKLHRNFYHIMNAILIVRTIAIQNCIEISIISWMLF